MLEYTFINFTCQTDQALPEWCSFFNYVYSAFVKLTYYYIIITVPTHVENLRDDTVKNVTYYEKITLSFKLKYNDNKLKYNEKIDKFF